MRAGGSGEVLSESCQMSERHKPGVSREQRISDEGLLRLQKQLQSGVRISEQVLRQWVKRYGEAAELVIQKYRKESIKK